MQLPKTNSSASLRLASPVGRLCEYTGCRKPAIHAVKYEVRRNSAYSGTETHYFCEDHEAPGSFGASSNPANGAAMNSAFAFMFGAFFAVSAILAVKNLLIGGDKLI